MKHTDSLYETHAVLESWKELPSFEKIYNLNNIVKHDTNKHNGTRASSPSLSSSGHDLDDLPCLSLDSDKPGKVNLSTNPNNRPELRTVRFELICFPILNNQSCATIVESMRPSTFNTQETKNSQKESA
ncbi:hypothetical protein L6452_43587 [Arctium lappa]|uniref:Uncharacterized protein n=1 Tax=Arctium lappa TaxID=4217 RepID=A0ACB8XCX4_ARCLA|nr:hypothetical protein L6452_43587 [Arctium lappa]